MSYVCLCSQVITCFYKIPMGRNKGEDVTALEDELKDKFVKLNEVSCRFVY